MNLKIRTMHITPVGGNVFTDLGFESEEAAALQTESKRIISEKLSIKESLVVKQRAKLSRLGVETASNSFHPSM